MSTGTLSSYASRASHRRVATALVFGFLAIVTWLATGDWMRDSEIGGRFTVGSLGFFVVLWVLMMGAMMFPSVWPAVATYGLVIRRRASEDAPTIGLLSAFVSGYLAAWAGFGLLAFGLLAVVRGVGLDTFSDESIARWLVAPVAIAAALYQAVPLKQACLRQCRGPLSFFLVHWRNGSRGAFVMGARHGGYCIGCCWLLMLVLLALGVMSITWMAVVSLGIAVEKLAPARLSRAASGLVAASLLVIAVVALVRPGWLPGMGGTDDMGSGGQMMDEPAATK
jgi:predicted metal-binding membrane protein